jgi:hypothetical protein
VALIEVLLTTVNAVAAMPPKSTMVVVGVVKFVPMIVTAVPPAAGPKFGETLDTVEVAANTYGAL